MEGKKSVGLRSMTGQAVVHERFGCSLQNPTLHFSSPGGGFIVSETHPNNSPLDPDLVLSCRQKFANTFFIRSEGIYIYISLDGNAPVA